MGVHEVPSVDYYRSIHLLLGALGVIQGMPNMPIQGFAKLSALEGQLEGQDKRSGVIQTPQDLPNAGVGSHELPSVLQPTQECPSIRLGLFQGMIYNEAICSKETHQAWVQDMGAL